MFRVSAAQLHNDENSNNNKKNESVIGDNLLELKRERKSVMILTNHIEGLTFAIIIVLEFPPRESCIICLFIYFDNHDIMRKICKDNKGRR